MANIYHTFGTQESLASHKRTASECKADISDFFNGYEYNLASNRNLGEFYRFANNKFHCETAVGSLKDTDGLITIKPAHKADIKQHTF
jgi:hypothetical protein